MATETKKRSADEVATLFVEQAVRVTREYQERMQETGSDHYLTAVYNTVVCGGINTELSPRQARWLTSLLKAERRETPQGSVLADGQPVGTWLYRSWSDRRSNKTRHRIIYTLTADFAAATFGIDHETMQTATKHGQRIAVSDFMREGLEQYTQLAGERAIPDMESCVINLEHGRITLYGRNPFEGPMVAYSGEWYGDWMCAMSSTLHLVGEPEPAANERQ